jgi:hypothetical protein
MIQRIVLAGVRTSGLSFESFEFFESNTVGIHSSNGSRSQEVSRQSQVRQAAGRGTAISCYQQLFLNSCKG